MMQLNDLKNAIKTILTNSPIGRVIGVVNVDPSDLQPFDVINIEESLPDTLEHQIQIVLEGTDNSIILCYPHGIRYSYNGRIAFRPFSSGIIASRIMWLNT